MSVLPSLVINESFHSENSTWVHTQPISITRRHATVSHISSFNDTITGSVTSATPHLVVGSLNVNTLSIPKLDYILDRMNVHNIDIFLLQDTRHKADVESLYKRNASQYWKAFSPDQEGSVGSVLLSSPVLDSSQPGGQIILCRPQWGRLLFKWDTDKSGLGLALWADFSIAGQKIRILSTYLPQRILAKDGPPVGSLAYRIKQYARSNGIAGNPTEVVQHIIGRALLPCIQDQTPYIVGGDFNSPWIDPFSKWATSIGLSNHLVKMCPSKSRAPYTFSRTLPVLVQTHIDHILHNASTITPTFAASLSGGVQASISDHSIVLQGFQLNQGHSLLPPSFQQSLHPDVNLKDKALVSLFATFQETKVASLTPAANLSPSASSDALFDLQTELVAFLRKARPHHSSKRSSYKNNWSPVYAATLKHLSFLLEVRRHCHGYRNRFRWKSEHDSRTGIIQLVRKWTSSLSSSLQLSPEEVKFVDEITTRPLSYWTNLPRTSLSLVLQQVDKDIHLLRSAMHNRTRSKLRTSISQVIKGNAALKEVQSIKASIQHLLGSASEPTSLHVLKVDDKLIHSELDIHNALTSQFHHHFETPPEHSGGIHAVSDWTQIMQDEVLFLKHGTDQGVPPHLTNLIWKAMHVHDSESVLPQVKEELDQILSAPPTLTEFRASIKRAPRGSSPGVSGFSYSILSLLIPSVTEYIHSLLCNMWESKYQPEWWKWRWLSVLPKVPNPSILQFRPIMLLEATRKLWTGLVAKKISVTWEKHHILHPAQFGARPRTSTYNNLLQTIASLESSRLLRHELYIGCWDLKKAFDCPSKPVLKMAWARLGVPNAVAEWLVGIDAAGPTIIRTPISIAAWQKHGYSGFVEFDPLHPSSNPTFFRAQRGTGQGDNPSPSNFISVSDVLLHALSSEEVHPMFGPTDTFPLEDKFYVDDQTSLSPSLAKLQWKADVISAFNIIFGFDYNLSKSEVFVQSPCPTEELVITVHGVGWASHTIPVRTTGSFKSLGVLFDIDGSGSTQLSKATAHIKSVAQILSLKRSPTAVKLMVTRLVPMNQLLYYGALSPWSLEQYKELDKSISVMFRRITNNQNSYPDALLYLPKSKGGLGLPHLSQVMQQRKWSAITGEMSASSSQKPLLFLLSILSSQVVAPPLPGQSIRIPPITFPSVLRSLSEWLYPYGSLYKGGDDYQLCPLAPLHNHITSPIHLLHFHRYGLASAVDLFADRIKPRVANATHSDLVPFAEEAMEGDLTQYLRHGQLWFSPSKPAHIYILTVTPEELFYQEYNCPLRIYPHCFLPSFPPSLETSIPKQITHEEAIDLFDPEDDWLQVYYSIDTFKVSRLVPSYPPLPPCNLNPFESSISKLAATIPPNYIICTDGSWRKSGRVTDILFSFDSHLIMAAGSAVILIHNSADWYEYPVIGIELTGLSELNLTSVYPAEVLALALACLISQALPDPISIYSDSQSSLKHVKKFQKKRSGNDPLQSYFIAISSIMEGPKPPQLHHIAAHPEIYARRADWSVPNWGNFLADHLCSNKWDQGISSPTPNFEFKHYPYPVKELLIHLGCLNKLYFTSGTTNYPLLCSPPEYLSQFTLSDYTSNREILSHQLGRNSVWSPSSVSILFSAIVAAPLHKHIAVHAKSLRVQWNKGYFGDNRSKYKLPATYSDSDREILTQCEFCAAPHCDQQHWIVGCQYGPFPAMRQSITDKYMAALTPLHSHPYNTITVPFLEQILKLALLPDGFRFWTGMITRMQSMSLQKFLPSLNARSLASLTKQLGNFCSILLKGSIDMWLLRWETPFPPEFLNVVSSSVLLSPFFKFKIPRNLRIRSPRATATQVLCKLNAQIKAKRTTQRRLGQAITSAPKKSVAAIKQAYKNLPAHQRSATISKAHQGLAKNQQSQEQSTPSITLYFPISPPPVLSSSQIPFPRDTPSLFDTSPSSSSPLIHNSPSLIGKQSSTSSSLLSSSSSSSIPRLPPTYTVFYHTHDPGQSEPTFHQESRTSVLPYLPAPIFQSHQIDATCPESDSREGIG